MDQQRTGGFVLHRAAAERQHDLLFVVQLLYRLPFSPAELRFAMFAEYLRYRALAGVLNDLVQVDEPPAQVPGQNRADGGFAGAHETGQDQPRKPLCHLRIIKRSDQRTV